MGLVEAARSELRATQLRSVVAHGDAAAGDLVPTTGNKFELLEGYDRWLDQLVDDIAGAERQFNFTTYAVAPSSDGKRVQRFLDATIAKAQQDVPVTGIVDQVGSSMLLPTETSRLRRDFIEQLRDNHVDVKVRKFSLGRGGLNDARLAVDHRKVYEIDGWTSHQGGFNLVDGWSDWHDMMLRMEGPGSAQAGALLAARWRDLGGTVPEARAAVLEAGIRRPVDDAAFSTVQLSNGNRDRRELTEHFVTGLRNAKERVWIANPYLGDERVMDEVVGAARRGLDVRVLLAPKAASAQGQDAFTDPLRRAWAHAIQQAGGSVVLLPEFSHAKGWIFDDMAAVGSFNLERGATSRNYENAVATWDPDAVGQLEELFHRQTGRGLVLGADAVAGWRGLDRLRSALHLQY
jgi:phosphatidylserine/phosphatidylglycerophosphate/cardiolipin synthase-like enzyme